MDLVKIAKALGSQSRCHLLSILDQAMSLAEIIDEYKKRGYDKLSRETIYRHLEKLVDLGFLGKRYSKEDKLLLYNQVYDIICIDLVKCTATPRRIDGEDDKS